MLEMTVGNRYPVKLCASTAQASSLENRPEDRAPDSDDAERLIQQLRRILAKMIAHPERGAEFTVIIMDAARVLGRARLAGRAGPFLSVKNDDAPRRA